jgi:hypothetical protein
VASAKAAPGSDAMRPSKRSGAASFVVRRAEEAHGMVARDAAAFHAGGPGGDAQRVDQQRRGGVERGVGDVERAEAKARCRRRSWAGHLQQLAEARQRDRRCQDLQCLEQHRLVRGDHGPAEARFDIRDTFHGAHVGAGQDERPARRGDRRAARGR